MQTILVTGGNGQLGNSIRSIEKNYPGYTFLYTDVDTLDICDKHAVRIYVSQNKVDYIINCAAYTAVDKAEDEPELAYRINSEAVRNLAEAGNEAGACVIHVSTDYVFDGTHCAPYIESDPVSPVSVYGKTKQAGEEALLSTCPAGIVVRTSWLYSEFGANFVKTMIRLGKEREELKVIFDQVGSPTYAVDLAAALLSIVVTPEEKRVPGVYHFSNEGVCSWYDFAVKIMQLNELDCRVLPIETKEYPTKAVRPQYSVLNKTKIKLVYGLSIPHWEESLRICCQKIAIQ